MNLKKYFVIVSLFLALIASIYIYIQYNLARYSVYYASHMPRKEGTRPELVMTIENKNLIDKPNSDYIFLMRSMIIQYFLIIMHISQVDMEGTIYGSVKK